MSKAVANVSAGFKTASRLSIAGIPHSGQPAEWGLWWETNFAQAMLPLCCLHAPLWKKGAAREGYVKWHAERRMARGMCSSSCAGRGNGRWRHEYTFSSGKDASVHCEIAKCVTVRKRLGLSQPFVFRWDLSILQRESQNLSRERVWNVWNARRSHKDGHLECCLSWRCGRPETRPMQKLKLSKQKKVDYRARGSSSVDTVVAQHEKPVSEFQYHIKTGMVLTCL